MLNHDSLFLTGTEVDHDGADGFLVDLGTIGLKRATAAITLANMAYNMTRWRWLDSRAASA